jgi:transposase
MVASGRARRLRRGFATVRVVVSTVSGWRALRRLGQTPQRPRPRHKRTDPEAQEAFKESPAGEESRSTGAVP